MADTVIKAVETLKNGGVILLPTETVYGIAADARNKSAIEKIYEIKGRDLTKPLQVMVATLEEAEKIAVFNDEARALAKKFWPGALTIILKLKQGSLPNNFNKLNDTIGIRIPNHEIALEILREFNAPLAASSANISGDTDNVSFAEAKGSLGEGPDFFVDGGGSVIGISSTVVDMTDGKNPKILRQGSVDI